MDISVLCEDKTTAELLEKTYPQLHIYKNVFPYVMRKKDGETLREMLKEDEILVRTPDGLGFLLENGYKGRIVADAQLYTFNRSAKDLLEKRGVFLDTVPLELNFHEIRERGTQSSELMIYGHVPMMISSQCLYKNTEGCRKDEKNGHRVALRDRMGKKQGCICFCRYCYNVIFNSVPLSLHTQMDRIRKLDLKSLRLYFTLEDPGEAVRITDYFVGLVRDGKKDGVPPFKDYTTGHFVKGVE